MERYLSSTPTLVAPKPQEPLLLYLATTNQVVSAALVAQREVDEETMAAAMAGLADGEPDLLPVGFGAGKAGPSAESDNSKAGAPAESGTGEAGSAQPNEVIQRKKMMQHPVYFVSFLL